MRIVSGSGCSYTLDGFAKADDKGWGKSHNFGSPAAVAIGWKAAYSAGVDLIASDQYEDLALAFKDLESH